MNDANYWKNQLDILQSNPPKSSQNYYNQSFVDRMNEAQASIDNLVTEKDKSYSAYQQAQDDYDAFKGTVKRYEDVYRENEAKFGVENKYNDYEKSKEALLQIDRAMKMLPSSINRNAEVRLSQSEREFAYNREMDTYNKLMTTSTANSEVFKDVWNKAREAQTEATNKEIGQQYSDLALKENYWITKMDEFNQAEEKWRQARLEKQAIGSEYRRWQLNQNQIELSQYLTKLNNALARYNEAMDTQNYQRQLNINAYDKIMDQMKADYADKMINNYLNNSEKKNMASAYDAGGLLGRTAFAISGMKL